MPGLFDKKYWNDEVFQKYMETIPNTRMNMLLKSGAIVQHPEYANVLKDQVGGNYIKSPISGRIGGAPVNYDGQTNITASNMDTYMQGKVVVGRAKAWSERDFSFDITGGVDFLKQAAGQVHEYWDDVDQDTLIKIFAGIFAMTGTGNVDFVNNHMYDATAVTNSEGKVGHLDGTTLNTGMQKACGDQKAAFSLAIMHSVVATNLENLKILTYAKYNDADGIQRDTSLATVNGRLVMIDDGVPVDTSGQAPVYSTFVLGRGAIEFCNCGAKVPSEVDRDPKTNGGEDLLYTRQRKMWVPRGISYTMASQATASPTDAELATGSNWGLVKNGAGNAFYPHKMIPIGLIKSLG